MWEYYGILQNIRQYSGILWNIMEYYGIFRNIMEYYGILWNILEYSGILWHILEYSVFLKFSIVLGPRSSCNTFSKSGSASIKKSRALNLKNALIACTVYIVSIVAFYGLRGTVSESASKHWGTGTTGGPIIIGSDAASLPGGGQRHQSYSAFHERKTGGSVLSGSSGAATELIAEGQG